MDSPSSLPVPLHQLDKHQLVLETSAHFNPSPASLPVVNSTRAFWLHPVAEVNPLAKEGSRGPLTDNADVCIIGSGITGVSAAYHLAKSFRQQNTTLDALTVVILEARDFCTGATGRNGGHLTPNAYRDFRKFEKLYGTDQAIRQIALEHHTVGDLVAFIKENNLDDAVDLVEGTHFDLLFSENELEDANADFGAAKAAGIDLTGVQFFSKEEMKESHGTIYPAVNMPGYNVWPMKLVTEMYYNALNQSATSNVSLKLHTNTPVTAINAIDSAGSDTQHRLRRRWNVETPRGNISCSTVLHATNAYASHLLPQMTGPNGIIPARGQIIGTRASVSTEKITRAGWGGNDGFEYWFPRPVKDAAQPNTNGEQKPLRISKPLVILGGGREVTEPNFELYETDDSVVNPKVEHALKQFLPAVFPGKFNKNEEPEWSWTGIMGFSKLGDPFVGPVIDPSNSTSTEFDGQYISAGYTGHGMPRAYACAEAIAQLILHELSGKKRNTWTFPEWLPVHYLTWIRDSKMTALNLNL